MDRDEIFLKHILDECRFLLTNCYGRSLEVILDDIILERACLRSLEVIGETVKALSTDLRDRYPHIEWKKIAGLRDRLIHHYFGVDWDIVWDVINNRIPKLEKDIGKLIQQEFN